MGELIDKAKGRVKEVAGVATKDRNLEAEGKFDQLKGEIKGKFDEAKQRVKDAFNDKTRRDVP